MVSKRFQGMLLVLGLWLGLWTSAVYATDYLAPSGIEQQRLEIMSSTDEAAMRWLITDFQQLHPYTSVSYLDLNSVSLFELFNANYAQGTTNDVIISSAMDLQIELVNNGYAATHPLSAELEWLPDWAEWRQQAFGFTYEPAVIVYNKRLLTAAEVPQSRFDLIELLRNQTERFAHKVGTYDIANSGLGYLFASQDAEQSSTWGRLVENLSSTKARLYDNTKAILEAVRSGELLLGYNVLGSYAYTEMEQHPELGMVLPSDYTLVMSRIAFVSARARHPALGHEFLDYLLSERGQQLLADKSHLYPIHPSVTGAATYASLQQAAQTHGPLKVIKLGPALLTYQDKLKKANFLNEWEKVMR